MLSHRDRRHPRCLPRRQWHRRRRLRHRHLRLYRLHRRHRSQFHRRTRHHNHPRCRPQPRPSSGERATRCQLVSCSVSQVAIAARLRLASLTAAAQSHLRPRWHPRPSRRHLQGHRHQPSRPRHRQRPGAPLCSTATSPLRLRFHALTLPSTTRASATLPALSPPPTLRRDLVPVRAQQIAHAISSSQDLGPASSWRPM